jgi:hypothetical protein
MLTAKSLGITRIQVTSVNVDTELNDEAKGGDADVFR